MTIFTLIGFPASGKSTFATSMNDCVVVSSDAIREELFGSAEYQKDHNQVFAIAKERIAMAIKENKDVIFDATNLTVKARKTALDFNANQIAVFFTTSLEECKKRNAQRNRHVPENAIDKMSKKLMVPSLKEGFDDIWIF